MTGADNPLCLCGHRFLAHVWEGLACSPLGGRGRCLNGCMAFTRPLNLWARAQGATP